MRKIGIVDVDGHNFPNLALMKISAYHKSIGDSVEFVTNCFEHYDKIYVSKIFSDEYSSYDYPCYNADEVEYGGTGFAISVVDDKEVYDKTKDKPLPYEIEHAFPDYSIYPDLTKDTAYGFLSRGCCNDCEFCIVSKKEGRCSVKVADLSEFWNGQKHIKLLDPNILACRDHMDLLKQLSDSDASVDFTQGLDARFINTENANLLKNIKTDMVHFAFDFMKNEKAILKGLKIYKDIVNPSERKVSVYVLTNFDTTIKDDLYRIEKLKQIGFRPDIRIYRKNSLPQRHILRDLQRWCNNRFLYYSCEFEDYIPRKDGKSVKELYPMHFENEVKT